MVLVVFLLLGLQVVDHHLLQLLPLRLLVIFLQPFLQLAKVILQLFILGFTFIFIKTCLY